ncbi:MAG TPA: NTF2 fold immunity protein [Fimbriimonadaceae bacterium]|nr:NTF2 fold immunity protein [Fimbriimonadaceae bacterium]
MNMLISLIIAGCLAPQPHFGGGDRRQKGWPDLVPNEKIAIQIASSVLEGQYGEAYMRKSKPFKVSKIMGRWVVHGTSGGAGPEEIVERRHVIIDPMTCRIVGFGIFHSDENIRNLLRKIKPDRDSQRVTPPPLGNRSRQDG